MARSRFPFCVFLISFSVCCAIYPQQKQHMKEQQGVSTRSRVTLGEGFVSSEPEETPGLDRVKREVADCRLLETQGGRGLQRIFDADAETTHSFFIQPQPGFNRLVFRAKLNNKFAPGPWKYFKKSLVISSSRIEIDWTHPTWIPVKIEYFKTDVSFGPDRHALRVKVGENVSEELITRWWRTHSYEGFIVDAEGPIKVLFKCNSWSAVAESVVDRGEVRRTLLIACVLGGCFLLVVGAVTLYLLIARRSHPPQDCHNDLPPATSLLRRRHVNQDGDSDHIYESIDKGILAKLRQNPSSDTFAVGRMQPMKDHSGGTAEGCENTKTILDSTVRNPYYSSGIPSGDVRSTLAVSLLEEKEEMRERFGLDSPLESHYVEMHGIVSRTSSLNK